MHSEESIRYWAGGIGISAVLAGAATVLLLLQMPAPTPTPKSIADVMTTPRTPLVPRAASTPTSTRTGAASTRSEPSSPTAAPSSPAALASSTTAAASSPTAPASASAANSARFAAASARASATPVKAHITKSASATTLSAAERTLSEQLWTEQKKLDAEVVRIAAATPDGGRRATRVIARQFDVPANLVNDLHGQGIGYGEVATSLALSRQLVARDKVKREQAIERIVVARRSGQGWAALVHALDLNLGQVLADVRKTDADVTALLPLNAAR